MHYTNLKIRQNTIWKALIFTLLPMLLTGLVVYLLCCRSGMVEGEDSRAMKQEKQLFVMALNTINSDWQKLLSNYEALIKKEKDNATSALNQNVENAETALLNSTSKLVNELSDTAFIARIDYINKNFEQYFEQMEEFRERNEELIRELDNCNTGKTKGDQANVLTDAQQNNQDQRIRNLEIELEKVGRTHRAELLSVLATTNITRRNQRALLELLSFGKTN